MAEKAQFSPVSALSHDVRTANRKPGNILLFFPSFLCERSKYRAALLLPSWFFCRDCAAPCWRPAGWRLWNCGLIFETG
jgi:hypothetical protein